MSFRSWLNVLCNTKRDSVGSTGQSTYATNLTDLAVIEFMPVDANTRERLVINTPYELFQTTCDAEQDVKPGDVLVPLNSVTVQNDLEYAVKAVERWPWRGRDYKLIVVEDTHR